MAESSGVAIPKIERSESTYDPEVVKGSTETDPKPEDGKDTKGATDAKTSKPEQLTIKQLKGYPESVRKLSLPESTKEGQVQVGATRGKPFWMNYKLYGQGPRRIVWLCGHGDTIKAWRRHVLHFGHNNSEK